MLQVEVAYANATGIVLNPINWAGIELLKDTQGRYLFTNPQNTTTGRLWGRDVVSTQAMTQGRFLVGDFAGTPRSSIARTRTWPSATRTRTTSNATWRRSASKSASRSPTIARKRS
jgi:HK97 family phage major capsid protein